MAVDCRVFDAETADLIRAQLARLRESRTFAQAERSRRFLSYIVGESLAGRHDKLKGYAIGVEVFDREADFDPSVDAIVRVEAGRLRTRLQQYYEREGRADPIVVDLPKGSYAPRFKVQRGTAAAGPVGTADDGAAIAVLPLVSLGQGLGDEDFADGLTDAIISQLARNRNLSVTSFTSSMGFKGITKTLPEIANELNVDYVVEGTVMRAGDRLRITAQLILAATDRHLWTDSYERDTRDVLAVHAEVAQRIGQALGASMDAERGFVRPVNPAAYEENLLGRRCRRKLTEQGLSEAIAHFERALNLEQDYADAYAGLAGCLCAFGTRGLELRAPREIIPRGMELARQAIELDESSAEGRALLGVMLLKYAWDWPGAEAQFRRALEISPSDARALMQYGIYYESLGRHAAAVDYADRARRVDPLSRSVNLNHAWQNHQAGDAQTARAAADRLITLEPNFWGGYWVRGHIQREAGRLDAAEADFANAVAMKGGNSLPYEGLGYVRARKGDRDGAAEVLHTLEALAADGYVSPYRFAVVHAGLGDGDAVFDWLEKAFEERARSLAWIKVAREFASYRGDPRFQLLTARIGIPDPGFLSEKNQKKQKKEEKGDGGIFGRHFPGTKRDGDA